MSGGNCIVMKMQDTGYKMHVESRDRAFWKMRAGGEKVRWE